MGDLKRSRYLIVSSMVLGGIIAWLVRNTTTALLFGGKRFDARSYLVQAGIFLLLFFLYSIISFILLAVAGKITIRARGLMTVLSRTFLHYEKWWTLFLSRVDLFFLRLQSYLRENVYLILALALISLFAYGFELFNLNLTIDEEVHSTYTGPTLSWLVQGRWGMYLLNKFLFPYTVVPFMPLFVALLFHIGAVLLLLRGWEVRSLGEQIIIGSISISLPIMAYIYTFSTINFGIGIGLFCIALSLVLYAENEGIYRIWAFVPATFAIAIYQGLLPALVGVFLVRIIVEMHSSQKIIVNVLIVFFIHIGAVLAYYFVQTLIIVVGIIPGLEYVNNYFDLVFLKDNFYTVLHRVWNYLIIPFYSGEKSVYGIDIYLLGWCIAVASLGVFVWYFRSGMTVLRKYVAIALFISLLFLPFASSFLMQGSVSIRFMISLSIVLPGIVVLGIRGGRGIRLALFFLTIICIFQFLVATNHLFASSHLALQADRSLATRLIGKIEDAQAEAGVDQVKYMEVIGYYKRQSTMLIPNIETFGASFFGWNQGTTFRILPFLQTLGYSFQPLPSDRQIQMIEIANSMPSWPQKGSVMVIGDTALVKFGPYSDIQKAIICGSERAKEMIWYQDFCQ